MESLLFFVSSHAWATSWLGSNDDAPGGDALKALCRRAFAEPMGVNDALEGELAVLGQETLLDKRSGKSIPVLIHAYQTSLQAAHNEMY